MKKYKGIHNVFLIVAMVLIVTLGITYLMGVLSQNRAVDQISSSISNEIKRSQNDILLLSGKLEKPNDVVINRLVGESNYPFYIFRNGRLLFWSDYHLVPDYSDLSGNYRFRLLDLPQGTYLSVRQQIEGNKQLEVYSLIPLFYSARINNKYIPSGYNQDIFKDLPVKIFSSEYPDSETVFFEGSNFLFSVKLLESQSFGNIFQIVVATLLLLVFGAIGAFIFSLASKISETYKVRALVVFLLLWVFRFLLLSIEWSTIFYNLDIFDPQKYAVSWLNPSLADLLLNAILLLSTSVFLIKNRYHFSVNRIFINRFADWIGVILTTILSYGIWLLIYVSVSTFFIHSPYDINITMADGFTLMHVFPYLIILISFGFYFFFNHFFFNVFINPNSSIFHVSLGFLGGLIFCLSITYQFDIHWVVCITFFVLMAVLFVFKLYRKLVGFTYFTFIYVFSVSIAMSVMSAFTVYYFQQQSENEQKGKFANRVLGDNDLLGEFLLSEINDKVKKDIFIKNRFLTPFTSKATIEQKIRRIYLNNYFERYDITIHLYNNNGMPIEGGSEVSYHDIKENFALNDYKTAYDNLFLVSEKGNIQSRRYLDFIEIKRYGVNIGFIIIDLKFKKVIGNSVYPSLLVDRQFENEVARKYFDYAIYQDNKIVYHAGDYNYSKDFNLFWLNSSTIFQKGININGYSHLAVNGRENQVVVVSLPSSVLFIVAANFSFFFILLLFVILLFLIFLALRSYIKSTVLDFSTKIQLYLNLSFFIPLVAVSITSMYMIISTTRKERENEYYKKAESISQSLTESVDLYSKNLMSREDLYTELAKTTRYSEDDINIYNASGRLIATSQPLIYENNLLSDYINPSALAFIKELGFTRKVLHESVGNLDYESAYVAIRSSDTGNLIGVIGIPFFSAQSDLNRQLILVSINTLIIFSLIFIVFLLASFFVASALTYPLKYIANRISKISLSEANEPLFWNSQDEIGLLVSEYNRMLKNLEASKWALAQSEKESAWKEMARQVAHEIKNPLTPMKLSLQHLHRMISDGRELEHERLEKTISTLLVQIELLNDIATSFSSFAQMPILQNERFDINDLLKQSAHLYQSNEGLSLITNLNDSPVWVNGDKALMSRIFTNLILNGLQAVPQERLAEIRISLSIQSDIVRITISDNGNGIPSDVQEKVFLPNFSTKFTGSGIGLAIAKRGIEHANGSIWFETKEGQGTDFFIELPNA